jgi:hypothetical protein
MDIFGMVAVCIFGAFVALLVIATWRGDSDG